jgi:hypothetical protein
MDIAKGLAVALSLSRVGFGLSYLLRPGQARQSWIGRAAGKPGTQVIVRSQGARDIALGAGALRAVFRGTPPELRAWMAGHALSDGADLAATWAARGHLPRRRARLAMAIAGASTVIAAASAAGLRR